MNVHLNRVRVAGGAQWAEPRVQFPAPRLPSSGTARCLACNPITQEVKAGRLEVQGHPCLHNKFEASLGYTGLCLSKPTEKRPAARSLSVSIQLLVT